MGDFKEIKKQLKNYRRINPYENQELSKSNFSNHYKNINRPKTQASSRQQKRTVFSDFRQHQGVQTQQDSKETQFTEFRPQTSQSYSKTTRDTPKITSYDDQNIKSIYCQLNDPDLPIVSEVDHVSSRCYCDLCTCGMHFCPSQQKQNLYPKSVFRTHYNNNFFDRGTPILDKGSKKQGYKLSGKQKLESLTTKMIDYKHHQLPKGYNPYAEMELNRPTTTKLSHKFYGLSHYSTNYPNWGPTHPHFEGPSHLKLRTTELPFEGKSNYTLNYRPPVQDSPQQTLKAQKTTESALSRNSSIPYAAATSAPFNEKTHYNMNFHDKTKDQLLTRSMKIQHDIAKNQIPPELYKTTYQTLFKGMQPFKKYPSKGGKKKFFI